jgi:hypothetical protein
LFSLWVIWTKDGLLESSNSCPLLDFLVAHAVANVAASSGTSETSADGAVQVGVLESLRIDFES